MHISHGLVLLVLLLLHLLGVRVHTGRAMHALVWRSERLTLSLALALKHVEERSVFAHCEKLTLGHVLPSGDPDRGWREGGGGAVEGEGKGEGTRTLTPPLLTSTSRDLHVEANHAMPLGECMHALVLHLLPSFHRLDSTRHSTHYDDALSESDKKQALIDNSLLMLQKTSAVFAAAFALRLALFESPALTTLLGGRVEISTPITSFKRCTIHDEPLPALFLESVSCGRKLPMN